MKQIDNELRKFIYAPWIPATLALTLAFLCFFFMKVNAGQADTQTVLLFLVSERKYHAILYALLAVFVFALDVDSGAVDAQLMAGHTVWRIVLRKSAIYLLLVLALNAIYTVVCIWGYAAANVEMLRILLVRMLLDIGTAAVFIPIQAVFRTMQPTLILNGAAVAVFIVANSPDYKQWYAVINGSDLLTGKIFTAVAVVALCIAATVVLLRRYRT